MSIMVLGAIAGIFILVFAIAGSKLAREALVFVGGLMAALLVAIWYFYFYR